MQKDYYIKNGYHTLTKEQLINKVTNNIKR